MIIMLRYIIIISAFVLAASALSAQEVKPAKAKAYKNVIKSNPFYSLAGWVPLTYERFIGKSTSFVLGASYITNEPSIFPGISKTYQTREGFYINPALRFYLFKSSDSPGGFYASPEFGWIQQTKHLGADSVQVYRDPTSAKDTNYFYWVNYPAEKITVNEFQIGATIGYQWVVKQVFVLDIYAGEGVGIMQFSGNTKRYYQHLNDAGYSSRSVPINGARLIAGAKVGIAF